MTPYRLLRRLLSRPPAAVSTPATIPLSRALLCIDCETIYAAAGPCECPACGSRHGWRVSRALDREARVETCETLRRPRVLPMRRAR